MTDWKALCEELADALACHYPGHVDDDELIKRARAALAETVAVPDSLPELRGMFERILCVARSSDQKPVGNVELSGRLIKAVVSWAASGAALAAEPVGEPAPPAAGELSDEDLGEPLGDLIDKWCQEGMQVKPYGTSFPLAHYVASRAYQYGLSKGQQPAPPAEGEVAEIVDHIRAELQGFHPRHRVFGEMTVARLSRTADLLERRQAAPVPVAVSERLPGANDVEAKLRYCWWWNQEQDVWMYGDASHADHAVYTHWLPFHALPLPAGEVEP